MASQDSQNPEQLKSIQVFICDDHPVVRQGLRDFISQTPDMNLCGEAASGKECLEALSTESVDVLVLDLCLPDMDGLQVLREVQVRHPDIPAIILSMYSEDHFALRCLKAGASGYLVKTSAPKKLVEAIRKVAQGGMFVSPELGEKLAQNLKGGADRLPHELLTEREFQVFLNIIEGKKLKEIAEELNLSIPTISTHKTNLLKRMRMDSVADLVRYALEHGLKP